jgi:hypothetical protein
MQIQVSSFRFKEGESSCLRPRALLVSFNEIKVSRVGGEWALTMHSHSHQYLLI